MRSIQADLKSRDEARICLSLYYRVSLAREQWGKVERFRDEGVAVAGERDEVGVGVVEGCNLARNVGKER